MKLKRTVTKPAPKADKKIERLTRLCEEWANAPYGVGPGFVPQGEGVWTE